jgi:uncharacterized protein YqhQ
MSEVQKPVYGGQAVVEGVMFGGKHHTVTAVRRKDSTITFYHLPRKSKPAVQSLKKIPFLRGIVALIQSSATGSKHLNWCTFLFVWKTIIYGYPCLPCRINKTYFPK